MTIKNRVLKESKKPLNEGPGAGYSVDGSISDIKITKIINKSVEQSKYSDSIYFEVEGTGEFDGDCSSYYYGAYIKDTVKITSVELSDWVCNDLGVNNLEEIGVNELNNYFSIYNVDRFESATIGAGWSHSTFDGYVESGESDDLPFGMNGISFEFQDYAIKFIDNAVQGNFSVDYNFDDNEYQEYFKSDKDAIAYAKENGYNKVEKEEWVLSYNHGDENYEDLYNSEVVWEKDEDNDVKEEGLKKANDYDKYDETEYKVFITFKEKEDAKAFKNKHKELTYLDPIHYSYATYTWGCFIAYDDKAKALGIKANENGEYEIDGKLESVEKTCKECEDKEMNKTIKEASYDLRPEYDSRQSFYSKARVEEENGGKVLYSYNTKVAEITSEGKVKLYPRWDESATTLRHVKEFLKQGGKIADTKGQIGRDYEKNEGCIKEKKEKSFRDSQSDDEIFDILGIEEENRKDKNYLDLIPQYKELKAKYPNAGIWLKGDEGIYTKGKKLGSLEDLVAIEEALKEKNAYNKPKREALDVTDQVIINKNEYGFLTKKSELEKQGYKVSWCGDGKICMVKPKEIKTEEANKVCKDCGKEVCDCNKNKGIKESLIKKGSKAIRESIDKKNKINESAKILIDISEYTPWSGAVETWDKIQEADKVDELDSLLEDIYPDGLTRTELNDILWFDAEWVLESLGLVDNVTDDADDDFYGNEEEEGK